MEYFVDVEHRDEYINITLTIFKFVIIMGIIHCVKYRNFTKFPGVGILWKGTVSA